MEISSHSRSSSMSTSLKSCMDCPSSFANAVYARLERLVMAREGLDIIDEEGIIQLLGLAKVFDDWTRSVLWVRLSLSLSMKDGYFSIAFRAGGRSL